MDFKSLSTAHYIFYFESASLAEQEISAIAEEQEHCFDRICNVLDVKYPGRITYYLLDSAEKVGVLFGVDEPINGFAVLGESKIYATYNQDIRCIGCHEDVHLISSVINIPKSDFLLEGLAMYFDETWWSISNEIWACYYKKKHCALSIQDMILNKDFYACDCMVTYPCAGAFIKFLINHYGMNSFIALYRYQGEDFDVAFESVYGLPLAEIEDVFWNEMLHIDFDISEIENALKDET